MNINELIREMSNVDCKRTNSVKISFVEKRRNGLTAYVPAIGLDLKEVMVRMFVDTLSGNPCFQMEQEAYNILGKLDDVIETSDANLGKIDEKISAIKDQANQSHDLTEMDLNRINFYMIEIITEDQNQIIIFRRFNKQKQFRKGLRGWFTGNDFKLLEDEEVVGINKDIDLICFKEELLILNRFSLQVVGDMKDQFIEKSKGTLNEIKVYNQITNFDQFYEDCLQDGMLVKRITSISKSPELISKFFEKYENLPSVIEEASLNININSQGKIEYTGDRSERLDIFKCIADKLYRTLLQGKLGEDRL